MHDNQCVKDLEATYFFDTPHDKIATLEHTHFVILTHGIIVLFVYGLFVRNPYMKLLRHGEPVTPVLLKTTL